MLEIDHEYTQEIVCPYCGHKVEDSWELSANEGEFTCEECNKTFDYTRDIEITYSTEQTE